MVAALAYNQWFTKLYCKDLRLVGPWTSEGREWGGFFGSGSQDFLCPSVLRAQKC